jgi:hypothetical protein
LDHWNGWFRGQDNTCFSPNPIRKGLYQWNCSIQSRILGERHSCGERLEYFHPDNYWHSVWDIPSWLDDENLLVWSPWSCSMKARSIWGVCNYTMFVKSILLNYSNWDQLFTML